jgi:hypothetical protein
MRSRVTFAYRSTSSRLDHPPSSWSSRSVAPASRNRLAASWRRSWTRSQGSLASSLAVLQLRSKLCRRSPPSRPRKTRSESAASEGRRGRRAAASGVRGTSRAFPLFVRVRGRATVPEPRSRSTREPTPTSSRASRSKTFGRTFRLRTTWPMKGSTTRRRSRALSLIGSSLRAATRAIPCSIPFAGVVRRLTRRSGSGGAGSG